jgi:hypothetical protein
MTGRLRDAHAEAGSATVISVREEYYADTATEPARTATPNGSRQPPKPRKEAIMGFFGTILSKLGIGSAAADSAPASHKTVLARIAANGGNVPQELLD